MGYSEWNCLAANLSFWALSTAPFVSTPLEKCCTTGQQLAKAGDYSQPSPSLGASLWQWWSTGASWNRLSYRRGGVISILEVSFENLSYLWDLLVQYINCDRCAEEAFWYLITSCMRGRIRCRRYCWSFHALTSQRLKIGIFALTNPICRSRNFDRVSLLIVYYRHQYNALNC